LLRTPRQHPDTHAGGRTPVAWDAAAFFVGSDLLEVMCEVRGFLDDFHGSDTWRVARSKMHR
jgi:hypothetical protein